MNKKIIQIKLEKKDWGWFHKNGLDPSDYTYRDVSTESNPITEPKPKFSDHRKKYESESDRMKVISIRVTPEVYTKLKQLSPKKIRDIINIGLK